MTNVHPFLRAFVALLIVSGFAAVAQGPNPSVPPSAFPTLPDVETIEVEIIDLDEAPPIAQRAILQLVALGAYPLTAEMEALPNAPLDARTAAFMLVNLFAPSTAQQFPVPADEALAVLAVVAGAELAPDAVLSAGALRDLLLAVVQLSPEQEAELRAVLDARYPALQAGNPNAPITRAGAALMMSIALEHLTTPTA